MNTSKNRNPALPRGIDYSRMGTGKRDCSGLATRYGTSQLLRSIVEHQRNEWGNTVALRSCCWRIICKDPSGSFHDVKGTLEMAVGTSNECRCIVTKSSQLFDFCIANHFLIQQLINSLSHTFNSSIEDVLRCRFSKVIGALLNLICIHRKGEENTGSKDSRLISIFSLQASLFFPGNIESSHSGKHCPKPTDCIPAQLPVSFAWKLAKHSPTDKSTDHQDCRPGFATKNVHMPSVYCGDRSMAISSHIAIGEA